MQNITFTAAVFGLSMLAAGASAGGYSPQVGRPHPDFVLPNLVDGSPVALSEFRGRKVLLIHFASW